jgi:Flp pilus assembly protein TadB
MSHQIIVAATTLLAATTKNSRSFHIGPWIIVPIAMLIAIIGTPIYIVRDRRKRRSQDRTR